MLLIPFQKIKITSILNQDDVFKKLSIIADNVDSLKIGGVKKSFRKYEGVFKSPSIKIRRNLTIGYSAFLPIADIVCSKKHKNTIFLKISLHKIVKIFLSIVMMFLIVKVIFSAINYNSNSQFTNQETIQELKETMNEEQFIEFEKDIFSKGKDSSSLIMNMSFLIIGYFLLLFYFNYESKILIEDIKNELKK